MLSVEPINEIEESACGTVQDDFSAYLDGALDGETMLRLAAHLDTCIHCSREFGEWRSMQSALGELGPALLPNTLQSELRDALAGERGLGTHRSPTQRFVAFAQRTLAPGAVRLGAGFGAALLLLGSAAWYVGLATPVQANDDRLAHLYAPRYLYSQTAPQPILSDGAYVAVMVDAKVDARGRVYDYDLIDGPDNASTRLGIEKNLLGSVFAPATIFGAPVAGHVMMTYTEISPL